MLRKQKKGLPCSMFHLPFLQVTVRCFLTKNVMESEFQVVTDVLLAPVHVFVCLVGFLPQF